MNNTIYTPLRQGGKTLLIDTDIGPDCDDAGALAVAAGMAKRYRVPVGAVVSCTSSPRRSAATAGWRSARLPKTNSRDC